MVLRTTLTAILLALMLGGCVTTEEELDDTGSSSSSATNSPQTISSSSITNSSSSTHTVISKSSSSSSTQTRSSSSQNQTSSTVSAASSISTAASSSTINISSSGTSSSSSLATSSSNSLIASSSSSLTVSSSSSSSSPIVKTIRIQPFASLTREEYFKPITIKPTITYNGSETLRYFLENSNPSLINASVNSSGTITISSTGNGTGVGVSRLKLIAFTSTSTHSHSFTITIKAATSGGVSALAFNVVNDRDWDETAVRKVLYTFAYGGHATDRQIKTWADMSAERAIVQMLTLNPKNNLLSPLQNSTLPNTTSLETLSKFWSSNNRSNFIKSDEKERFNVAPRSWGAPETSWTTAVFSRGLNPFVHRVGFWETNFHMSVSRASGIYPLPLFSFYDGIMDLLSKNRSYKDVIAKGAKSAAVAYQYGHNKNVFRNGRFRGNEDFAREYHQLFFGILGEYDHSYHEETAIPNTARALTDMRAVFKTETAGGPDRVVTFGTEFHYDADLDILHETISGDRADKKIDAIADIAIKHEESLKNLPVTIISHFADDTLTAPTIDRIRRSWAMMDTKRLLPFLRAYAISTDFHNPSRIKYASSIQRMVSTLNLLTIENEEVGYMFYSPTWWLSREDIRIFTPKHAVFGHQTGLEASNDGNIFRLNYNLSTQFGWLYWRYYTCDGKCKKDANNNPITTWEKKWQNVIPANSRGEYIVEDVARWLWERFIVDGGKHYGALERAHVVALLNGKDLSLLINRANPLAVYNKNQITNNSSIKTLIHDASVAKMDLKSSDGAKQRAANYRVNLAISFIVATPYIYAQEGR